MATFMETSKNFIPDIRTIIVLHSISKEEYEVIDIGFDDEYDNYEMLSKQFSETNDNLLKRNLLEKLCRLDAIREMAEEEVNDYGETAKEINADVWEKNQIDRYYCICVDLSFNTTRDYFGEYDTDVYYEYTIVDFRQYWNNLDFLKVNSKLYYLDYEESASSYTITNLYEVHDNPVMKTGLYYTIHSDALSNETGYYPLNVNNIDAQGSRFFSSPELAHEAYSLFKKQNI